VVVVVVVVVTTTATTDMNLLAEKRHLICMDGIEMARWL
jgi:hypothetical protein